MRMTASVSAAVLLVTAALTGCSATLQQPLVGTTWELLSLQSNNDAQPTKTVPDPGLFTVTFDKDDKAIFLFDCNRGKSSYSTKPTGDGSSGTLTFGQIEMTKLMCAQPSLDQLLIQGLPEVRNYTYKDGELHLTKMADGGVLNFRRA